MTAEDDAEALRERVERSSGDPIIHTPASSNLTQNPSGKWVPAIPMPLLFWLGRRRCTSCGRTFWTEDGYRGHYAYAHALGMEEGP